MILQSLREVPFHSAVDKLYLGHHLHFELLHFMKGQLECVRGTVIRVMKHLETLLNEALLKELEMIGMENKKLGRKYSKMVTIVESM